MKKIIFALTAAISLIAIVFSSFTFATIKDTEVTFNQLREQASLFREDKKEARTQILYTFFKEIEEVRPVMVLVSWAIIIDLPGIIGEDIEKVRATIQPVSPNAQFIWNELSAIYSEVKSLNREAKEKLKPILSRLMKAAERDNLRNLFKQDEVLKQAELSVKVLMGLTPSSQKAESTEKASGMKSNPDSQAIERDDQAAKDLLGESVAFRPEESNRK